MFDMIRSLLGVESPFLEIPKSRLDEVLGRRLEQGVGASDLPRCCPTSTLL